MLCLEIDENHELAAQEMGSVLCSLEKFDESILYSEKCLKINKRNIEAHHNIAKVY